jgi:hypothetical protein
MTVRKSGFGASPPMSAFLRPSSPRALLPAGWVTLGEAITWVGFARAVPVRRWDRELVLGLSLWPWYPPFMVRQWFRMLARDAVLGTMPFTKGMTPGHHFWLVEALRELGSHRPFAGPHPVSAESPDERLRAEAAHRHDAWDEATKSEVSAAFLTATLASDALRAKVAEGAIALHGVPKGREGVEVDLAPREAIPPAVCAAPVTLTPDGLYQFTPDDVTRSMKLGPSYVEVVAPARDLARVFPRNPGDAPDLLEAALDRKPELGEADALAAQQDHKPEHIARTGSPGRPSMSKELYMPEHRRRLASGEALADLTDEARYLRNVWLPREWPGAAVPSPKTLKDAIRPEHRKHFGQPRLKNAGRSLK